MTATMIVPPVVAPLDFGPDFDPAMPEGHISSGLQMRLDLDAQHKAKKHRESQVKRLRKSADALQFKIDECIAQIGRATQDYTALSLINSEDKARLLQSALLIIADGVEKDTLPAYLQALDSKGVIDAVVTNTYPVKVVGKTKADEEIAALTACGIDDAAELTNTHEVLLPLLWTRTKEQQYVRDIQISTYKCRQKLPYTEYETPKALAGRMVFAAKIEPGQSVLEPSAGLGAIADVILAWEKNITLHVVEKIGQLREHLELKKFEVIPIDDFLTAEFSVTYDRIVMSPPWDKGMDMEHVMKAAELLNPNGRLVALVSQQSFDRKDHKGKRYREWVTNTHTNAVPVSITEFKKMPGTSGVVLTYQRKGPA